MALLLFLAVTLSCSTNMSGQAADLWQMLCVALSSGVGVRASRQHWSVPQQRLAFRQTRSSLSNIVLWSSIPTSCDL